MTCPQCQGELTKTKLGYMCLMCGYAGEPTHGHDLVMAAEAKARQAHGSPEDTEPTQIMQVKTFARAKPAPINAAVSDIVSETDEVDTHEISTDIPKAPDVIPAPVRTDPIPETPNPLGAQPPQQNAESSAAAVPVASAPVVPLPTVINAAANPVPTPGSIIHPASSPTPPATTSPPPKPKHRRPVRTMAFIGVAVGIVVLAAAAYVLPAAAAARALNKKLDSAQSFAMTGNLTIKANSFLSVLSSNLNFNGTYSAKSANSLNYSGVFASRNYTGSFITDHSQLYSQMTGADLPFIRYNQGLDTYHILPSVWYQTKADNSLYKYYCETRPDTKYPSPLVWYQALRQVKLRPSPLIEYAQTVDGHSTTHLQGSISGQELNAAWNNINSSLPDDCQWNNLLADVSGLNVHYDAWTSKSFDQIELHFNDKDLGINGTMLLKLNQYNQAPAPVVPTNTLDLANIFAVRAAIQSRDYTRRANVDAISSALNAYYAAKKNLPASLVKLTPTYIKTIPTDPSTGTASYTYATVKNTYSISTVLEDAGQLYTDTGP